MAQINITDEIAANATLQLRDDAPLAKAGLTKLVATDKKLIDELNNPVDQTDIKSLALGGTFTSPDLLSAGLPNLTLAGGVNSTLSVVKAADKTLFGSDQFAMVVPIAANQAWVGVEFDASLDAKAKATVDGIGITEEVVPKAAFTTFTLITSPAAPLPKLGDACQQAFDNFSVVSSAAGIRAQKPGTLHQVDVSGTVTTTVSMSAPFTLNALASATLPFNQTAKLQPNVTLKGSVALKLTGDLIIRSFKESDTLVTLGVYKKQGSTLTASLTAGAGLAGDFGSNDVLTTLLTAAIPGVDVAKAGITGDNAKELNGVIKNGIDKSLSAQINATCSAAHTDEAAVVYQIKLDGGDPAETDKAMQLALQGDWTGVAGLKNATLKRDITVTTAEHKVTMTLNLFGFYNVISAEDYLSSSTVLIDDSGQLSFIDKQSASRIAANVALHADTEKLRRALVEDFVCTATYAVVSGKLNLQIAVAQSYLDYSRNMSRADLNENIRLGSALNVIPLGALNDAMAGASSFPHALVTATVKYDTDALMDIFYKDPGKKTPRTQDEVELAGRQVMTQLLDPSDDNDALRIAVLSNSSLWSEMDDKGSAAFNTIPGLSQLNAAQREGIVGDWASVRWWANSLVKIARALSTTLTAIDQIPAGSDPRQDANFMNRRDKLAHVLGDVTRDTNAAFTPGWGAAVMFALSGRHGTVSMDIGWDGKSQHFGA